MQHQQVTTTPSLHILACTSVHAAVAALAQQLTQPHIIRWILQQQQAISSKQRLAATTNLLSHLRHAPDPRRSKQTRSMNSTNTTSSSGRWGTVKVQATKETMQEAA